MDDTITKNIAETLAAELPKPVIAASYLGPLGPLDRIDHLVVPKGQTVHLIDMEKMLPMPRRTLAVATMGDDDSFIAYVLRHKRPNSAVWCEFDPTKSILNFTAVIDEHDAKNPGWRSHQAKFQPRLSAEWLVWTQHNKQSKGQVAFAEFIEQNERDIAVIDGSPSSLQMMQMATEFEARQDQRIKSSVRLQNGGIQLEYVADADKGTVERMKVFDRFAIGIPVFWSVTKDGAPVTAYPVRARLRYRMNSGAVSFYYDLIRPDLVHQIASLALIAKVRAGIGDTPLLMGGCS